MDLLKTALHMGLLCIACKNTLYPKHEPALPLLQTVM